MNLGTEVRVKMGVSIIARTYSGAIDLYNGVPDLKGAIVRR